MVYVDSGLVGLVTLYADEAPGSLVDVTINVHPNCAGAELLAGCGKRQPRC
ncbi:hypothetical protein [Lacticaseibacillus manihotivorans]|uniref:hypothetical protein n=1 Tax=Lacticaseibacillus manihotivorans TaxID=88233 RepID=UPI000A662C0B|nr:hypothetical protein [Lacticaseibacillus manihotivorans]